jgi:hypothetical protein
MCPPVNAQAATRAGRIATTIRRRIRQTRARDVWCRTPPSRRRRRRMTSQQRAAGATTPDKTASAHCPTCPTYLQGRTSATTRQRPLPLWRRCGSVRSPIGSPVMPTVAFHVSSSRNRESISEHGLDWTRMLDEPGIAGSPQPEGACVFLARDIEEAGWFVSLSRSHHKSVDVWRSGWRTSSIRMRILCRTRRTERSMAICSQQSRYQLIESGSFSRTPSQSICLDESRGRH